MLGRVLLSLVLLMVAGRAYAAPELTIGCSPTSAQFTLEQVRALPTEAWKTVDPNAPFVDLAKAEWCRLQVSGADTLGAVVRFKVSSALIAPVATFYWPDVLRDDQGTQVGVETRSFGGARHPSVLVEARHTGQPIYLRFLTRSSPRGVLEAWGVSDFTARVRAEQSFEMAVMASMAVLGLMASLFAYQLGRRVLIYLCLWVISVIVLRVLESGLFTTWVSIEEDARRLLNTLSLTVAIAFSVVFSDRYLKLGDHFPRISRLLMALVLVLIGVGLLTVGQVTTHLRELYNALIILQFMLVGICALVLFHRGDEMARFFILGWSPVLVMSVVRTLFFLTPAPLPVWLEPLWQVTLLFAVFVLLLVTARATRDAEREMHVVRRAASHDALTGLANRASLFEALKSGMAKARTTRAPLSLLFLDLDHFKHVNDEHGHDVGDHCLRHFAATLQSRLRADDMLARLGGEEFVVLLPGVPLEHARKVSDDLRNVLSEHPLILGDLTCRMTVSVGVAALRDEDDAESLLKRADAAVYRAKAHGRDRTVLETVFDAPALSLR